jgi:hypothetical protein
MGGRNQSECPAGMDRNRWPESVGISGRNGPEYAAFSKKIENLGYAVALHFMYYNFCRVHQTLRVTPAMEAGVTDHIWRIEEIISLIK